MTRGHHKTALRLSQFRQRLPLQRDHQRCQLGCTQNQSARMAGQLLKVPALIKGSPTNCDRSVLYSVNSNVGIEVNLQTHFSIVGFKSDLIEHMEMAGPRGNAQMFRELAFFD